MEHYESRSVSSFVLDAKPVYDWNHVPIGTVADMRRDPRTNAARDLVVTLNSDARESLGEDVLTIPLNYVFGIRKDAVTLDRSIKELRRIEVLHELTQP